MKRKHKQKRLPKKTKKVHSTGGNLGEPNSSRFNRRDLIIGIRNWSIYSSLTLVAGWFVVDQVTASIQEHDLSKIGNGAPAIVQIHDPECVRCRALQRETRKALDVFETGQFQYLVANIATPKGRNFANSHGVSHVTLLLFDGDGKRKKIIHGDHKSDYLISVFRSHLKQSVK